MSRISLAHRLAVRPLDIPAIADLEELCGLISIKHR